MIFKSRIQSKKSFHHYNGYFTTFSSLYGIEKVILLNHIFGIKSIYKAVIISQKKSVSPRVLCSEIFVPGKFVKVNFNLLEFRSDIYMHTLQIYIAWYAGFKVSESIVGYYNKVPIILLHKLKRGFRSTTIFGTNHQRDYKKFVSFINTLRLTLSISLHTSVVDLQEKLSYSPDIYKQLSKLREISLTETSTIIEFIVYYIKLIKKTKFNLENIFELTFKDLNIDNIEYKIRNISDLRVLIKKYPKRIRLTNQMPQGIVLYKAKCYLLLVSLRRGIFKGTWLDLSMSINAMFIWDTKIHKIDL